MTRNPPFSGRVRTGPRKPGPGNGQEVVRSHKAHPAAQKSGPEPTLRTASSDPPTGTAPSSCPLFAPVVHRPLSAACRHFPPFRERSATPVPAASPGVHPRKRQASPGAASRPSVSVRSSHASATHPTRPRHVRNKPSVQTFTDTGIAGSTAHCIAASAMRPSSSPPQSLSSLTSILVHHSGLLPPQPETVSEVCRRSSGLSAPFQAFGCI